MSKKSGESGDLVELKKIPLGKIGGGAAERFFSEALDAVLTNIDDERSPVRAARAITLKFLFNPADDRETANLKIKCSKSLPALSSGSSVVLQRDRNGKLGAYQAALPFDLGEA